MTNLLATIIVSVVTNWHTVSFETPSRPEPQIGADGLPSQWITLEYHATIYHQVGIVSEITEAIIDWKGDKITVELERKQLDTLARTIMR